MIRCSVPSTTRSTRTLLPAPVWRTWNRSLASTDSAVESIPCPYSTPGTRPAARSLRATPLPVPSLGSALSLTSAMFGSFEASGSRAGHGTNTLRGCVGRHRSHAPGVFHSVGILVTEARTIEGTGGQIADLYERHVP